MLQRKTPRRSSAQYCVSAEEHVENEVKHERLLTETSRLSSSWANLSVSGHEKAESDCSSSSVSASNSPNHRPSSFSGPLVISVTCSGISCPSIQGYSATQPLSNRCTPTSPNPHSLSSGHVSPVASPVSSRVQCYSPGLVPSLGSPTARRPCTASASPLLISTALCRKRGYFSSLLAGGGSSDDASREGSPDSSSSVRGTKSMRQADGRAASFSDAPHFRWPPGPPLISNPPSPSCHLFPSILSSGTAPSSPSTSSLPSPRLSFTSSLTNLPSSPASAASNSLASCCQTQQPPSSLKMTSKPIDKTDSETVSSAPSIPEDSDKGETVAESEPVQAS